MCGPVALGIASFAVGAAKSVAGFAAQQADYKAQKAASEQNRENALEAMYNDQRQLTKRQVQEEAAANQKKQLQLTQGAEAKAEAETEGVSRGVAGLSLDNILQDIGRKTGRNIATLDENWKMTAQQLQEEQKSTRTVANSRIASMPMPNKPSPLSLVAGIGGAGLSAIKSFDA